MVAMIAFSVQMLFNLTCFDKSLPCCSNKGCQYTLGCCSEGVIKVVIIRYYFSKVSWYLFIWQLSQVGRVAAMAINDRGSGFYGVRSSKESRFVFNVC